MACRVSFTIFLRPLMMTVRRRLEAPDCLSIRRKLPGRLKNDLSFHEARKSCARHCSLRTGGSSSPAAANQNGSILRLWPENPFERSYHFKWSPKSAFVCIYITPFPFWSGLRSEDTRFLVNSRKSALSRINRRAFYLAPEKFRYFPR